MDKICCQVCSTFFCASVPSMFRHLNQVHQNDPGLHVTCDVLGCQRSFTKISSYKSHLYRDHKEVMCPMLANDTNMTEDQTNIFHANDDEHMDVADNSGDRVEFDRRENAFYLLRTKESNLLSQKCLDDIVEGTTHVVRNTVDSIKSQLKECLDKARVQFDEVPGIEEIFSNDNPIYNPFEHVSSKYKQALFFKENFGLIPPQRITLGHRSARRRAGTQYKEVLKDDEMMYIPIIASLKQMLNQDDILSHIQVGHQRNDGVIEDYCDGKLFKTHPLFSKDPTALQIMLYYDELEIANPLGCKAGNHKLGVIYFTLGNIPPRHRSKLDSIQLLSIATCPVIKEYGIDALLEPFMNDLEYLEQDGGHEFVVKDEPMSFAGTITYVSGDNLGSQAVGGFKEGSGANLKCRHCMGDTDGIKCKFHEKQFTLRSRAGHDRHCNLVEQDEELGKMYGVRRKSILHNSRYYHVVDGLPGDAMHDVLEGVLQYKCKEMLKVFIWELKYFSLEQLNERIKNFDYGYYNDNNKPSTIAQQTLRSDKNSVKQKAAQMWCLAKFLPLMIGGVVPDDDEHWQHYLQLLEIVDIVFSPAVSTDDLGVLEGIIEEYLWNFTQIYPGKSVIPKMHYLVHYPSHIYRFGPMVRTWCMRYEAKHRYFKRLAGFMGNFTNVSYTLAERHQAKMCYISNSTSKPKDMTIGCGNKVIVGNTDYFCALKQRDEEISSTEFIYESKKVCYLGTEYRIGAIIQVGYKNDLPQFASIAKIVVVSTSKTYFVLKTIETKRFSHHFHAFEVFFPIRPGTLVLLQSEFSFYLPTHCTKASNTSSDTYIVTKINIIVQKVTCKENSVFNDICTVFYVHCTWNFYAM